jgi:Cu+-exporting ATPase
MVPAWQFPWWQWISFALTCVIVTWGCLAIPPRHAAQPAARQRDHGHLDLVGTLAAFGWSAYALFFGVAGEIGFHSPVSSSDSSDTRQRPTSTSRLPAGITTFLLLGRYLEAASQAPIGRSAPRAARPDTIADHAADSRAARGSSMSPATRSVIGLWCGPANGWQPTA